MTTRRLVVIEAPRKANLLQEILRSLDFEARVQATRGHILASPPLNGERISVDRGLREFERLPVDQDVVDRLRQEAAEAEEVFIATDADREGHVIAWDVATLIADIHPRPYRVLLKGMDADSVQEAFQNIGFVDKKDAIPGRTRAIVDRLIAMTQTKGVPVGRVSTAMLGLVEQMKPTIHRLVLVAPAAGGGRGYSASTEIHADASIGPITPDVARALSELRLPAIKSAEIIAPDARPSNTVDILVRAGDRLGIGPGEAMDAMQKLYEGGTLSYPRSGSRAMAPSVQVKFASILKKQGYTLVDGQYVKKEDGDVHDAPHPIGKVDLSSDPRKLGTYEGMRSMIGSDLATVGLPRRVDKPALNAIEDFLTDKGFKRSVVTAVVGLDWRREIGPRMPGEAVANRSMIEERRPDTVLLEKCAEMGLGQPSTYASHIEKFMARKLVNPDLTLTQKGLRWVAESPKDLLDPTLSAYMESAFDMAPPADQSGTGREPWETLAGAILGQLPPDLLDPIRKAIDNEPLREAYDPAAPYAEPEADEPDSPDSDLSQDIDRALQRSRQLTYDME